MRKKEDFCYKYREGKLDNMKYTTENALNEIKKARKANQTGAQQKGNPPFGIIRLPVAYSPLCHDRLIFGL